MNIFGVSQGHYAIKPANSSIGTSSLGTCKALIVVSSSSVFLSHVAAGDEPQSIVRAIKSMNEEPTQIYYGGGTNEASKGSRGTQKILESVIAALRQDFKGSAAVTNPNELPTGKPAVLYKAGIVTNEDTLQFFNDGDYKNKNIVGASKPIDRSSDTQMM